MKYALVKVLPEVPARRRMRRDRLGIGRSCRVRGGHGRAGQGPESAENLCHLGKGPAERGRAFGMRRGGLGPAGGGMIFGLRA